VRQEQGEGCRLASLVWSTGWGSPVVRGCKWRMQSGAQPAGAPKGMPAVEVTLQGVSLLGLEGSESEDEEEMSGSGVAGREGQGQGQRTRRCRRALCV